MVGFNFASGKNSLNAMKATALAAMSIMFGVKENKKGHYMGVGSAYFYSSRSPGSAANKRRRSNAQTRGGKRG